MAEMKKILEMLQEIDYGAVWGKLSPFLFRIVLALLLFFIGRKLIALLLRLLDRVCKRRLDHGVSGFLHAVANVALQVVLLIAAADIVGLPTTSFIAVLGSFGLAIGLSLQGSLSNFAGGILLLVTKPFVVGDYIVVGSYEGTVTDIGICYTKLRTADNRAVIMPNGTLSNSNLVNVNQEPLRRVDMVIPIAYEDDIRSMKELLRSLAQENENVLKTEPVNVFVKEFGADSINLGFRVWVEREKYWDTMWEMQEAVRYAMQEQGFTIPFRQMDVNLVQAEAKSGQSGEECSE